MSDAFKSVSGIVAPLLLDDVNTDLIIPTSDSIDMPRDQLGRFAFGPLRYDAEGRERPEFVLNQAAFRDAPILLAGANFGCGSSREPAAWALAGLGIRVIVARSFGEIFETNWVRNGCLPIALDGPDHTEFQTASQGEAPLHATIDLVARTISYADRCLVFRFDDARRTALLEGLDAIDVTLLSLADILAFQAADRAKRPWIWNLPVN